jgi:hypothetical protein
MRMGSDLIRAHAQPLGDLSHELCEIDVANLESELPLRLLRIEQRVDQRHEPVRLVKRTIGEHAKRRAWRAAIELAGQVLDLEADVRHRRAQLV